MSGSPFTNGKAPNSLAFPCDCGGNYSRVVDSRARKSGYVYRVRICGSCGDRIATHETKAGPVGCDKEISAFNAFIERSSVVTQSDTTEAK